jgi:excisionase family DNA binding protein
MNTKKENTNYLTAKETSELLNINEKKVYSLAQEGKLPGTKITGKWLFPRVELEAFLRERSRQTVGRFLTELARNDDIILIAGSHDPVVCLVEGIFHNRNPKFVIFSSNVGSTEGLHFLQKGLCTIALTHLYDSVADDYNFPFIADLFDSTDDVVVVNLFYRNIGFVSKTKKVTIFGNIVDERLRFINRQRGSGIRTRIDQMIAAEGLKGEDIRGYDDEVYTHYDVVHRIIAGKAAVGVAVESVSHHTGLYFCKFFEERFDMVIRKELFFEPNIQAFVEFTRSTEFLSLLADMRGYDNRDTGRIMYPR